MNLERYEIAAYKTIMAVAPMCTVSVGTHRWIVTGHTLRPRAVNTFSLTVEVFDKLPDNKWHWNGKKIKAGIREFAYWLAARQPKRITAPGLPPATLVQIPAMQTKLLFD